MKKKPERFVFYCMLLALIGVLRCMPRFMALAVADAGGWIAYHVVKRHRSKVDRNLAFVFPDKTEKERKRLAIKVFQNMGQTLADVILSYRLNSGNVREIMDAGEAVAVLNKLRERGKGVIFLSSHFGNWELVAAMCLYGLPGRALARKIYYEPYNRLLVENREHLGCHTVYRDDSPRKVLGVLRRNEILGVVPDQDMESVDGIFVDFYGHPVHTPTAPVKLAMASGAPILPAVVLREGKRYRVLVGKPIECRRQADKEEAVRRYTEEWSRSLEGFIREHPEQWAWMHDRWKRSPSVKKL
ncbi:MAG: lysophospholipid acyltransferase family protein [Candidatus Omnitrophica bacterium]|nr:lysophospholipid acyltransferase family protein [Candidatus Omnitrophota bacterium]